MKWKVNHVPVLLMASTIAMIGLIIFQYKWIRHSRELYNEIFHQRACMALCSTLEEYGEGAICGNVNCSTACELAGEGHVHAEDSNSTFVTTADFHTDLRKTLDFYNIDLNYQLTQTKEEPCAPDPAHATTCIVSLPGEDDKAESFIALDFPDQKKAMMGKLSFMIGASVMILLFTALVLLLANWWLLKQKRLLRTNVEMYNNLAHEFRTPLTNINLATNFLSREVANPKGNKFLDIISRENSKLITQVERVLHLARLDNGEYDLKNEDLHVKSLIETVRDEMSIQIEERNALVQIDIPAHFEIFGDRQHLTNVFRNLMDNALKYASSQPVISISAKEEKNGIVISVQDNGIGIPSSQSEYIFEKFQRVQQGNLHSQKGFGLGLAYVKKIVELHKGSVNVDSEVNKGSCFNVYLPKLC